MYPEQEGRDAIPAAPERSEGSWQSLWNYCRELQLADCSRRMTLGVLTPKPGGLKPGWRERWIWFPDLKVGAILLAWSRGALAGGLEWEKDLTGVRDCMPNKKARMQSRRPRSDLKVVLISLELLPGASARGLQSENDSWGFNPQSRRAKARLEREVDLVPRPKGRGNVLSMVARSFGWWIGVGEGSYGGFGIACRTRKPGCNPGGLRKSVLNTN